jgi:hypothetical protein
MRDTKEQRYLSGIALGYGRDIGDSSPGKGWEFFFVVHLASYPMGTRGSFPVIKVVGARS